MFKKFKTTRLNLFGVFTKVKNAQKIKFSRSQKQAFRSFGVRSYKNAMQFAKSRVAMGGLLMAMLLIGGASILEHVFEARAVVSSTISQTDFFTQSSTPVVVAAPGANVSDGYFTKSSISVAPNQAMAADLIYQDPAFSPASTTWMAGDSKVAYRGNGEILIPENNTVKRFDSNGALLETVSNPLGSSVYTDSGRNSVGDVCYASGGHPSFGTGGIFSYTCFNQDGTSYNSTFSFGCGSTIVFVTSITPDGLGGAYVNFSPDGFCPAMTTRYIDQTGTVVGASGPLTQGTEVVYNDGSFAIIRNGATYSKYAISNPEVAADFVTPVWSVTAADFGQHLHVAADGTILYSESSDFTLHLIDPAGTDTLAGTIDAGISIFGSEIKKTVRTASGYYFLYDNGVDIMYAKSTLAGSLAAGPTAIISNTSYTSFGIVPDQAVYIHQINYPLSQLVAYDVSGNLSIPTFTVQSFGGAYSQATQNFMTEETVSGNATGNIYFLNGVNTGADQGTVIKLTTPTYDLSGVVKSPIFDSYHDSTWGTMLFTHDDLVNSTMTVSVGFSNDGNEWTPYSPVTSGINLSSIIGGSVTYRYFRYKVEISNSDSLHSDYFTDFSIDFTYPDPAITSVAPVNEKAGGYFAITGTGFGAARGNSKVVFGGVNYTNASDYEFWSDTYIVFKVRTGTTAGSKTLKVTVQNPSTSLDTDTSTVNVDVTTSPTVQLTDASGTVQAVFNLGEPVHVKVTDTNASATFPATVTITTASGDSETLSVSGSGVTSASGLTVSSNAVSVGNGQLEGIITDQVTATYTNASALEHQEFHQNIWNSGTSSTTETTAEIDASTYVSGSNIYVKNNSIVLGKEGTYDAGYNNATGKSLIPSFTATAVGSVHQISDNAGGSIVAWIVSGNIYGQRIDANGNFLWGSGNPITLYGLGTATDFNMVSDTAGEYFFFAVEGGNDIRRHLISDGSMDWNAFASGTITLNPYNNGIAFDNFLLYVASGNRVDTYQTTDGAFLATGVGHFGLNIDLQIVPRAINDSTFFVCGPQFTSQIYCYLDTAGGSSMGQAPNTDGDNTVGWVARSDGNGGLLIGYVITGVTGGGTNRPAVFRYVYNGVEIVKSFHAVLSNQDNSTVGAPNLIFDPVSDKIFYVVPTTASSTKLLVSDLLGNFTKATQSTITISGLNAGGTSQLVTSTSGTDINLDVTDNNARNLTTDGIGGMYVIGNCISGECSSPNIYQYVYRMDQAGNARNYTSGYVVSSPVNPFAATILRTQDEELAYVEATGDPSSTLNALRIKKLNSQYDISPSGTFTSLTFDATQTVNFNAIEEGVYNSTNSSHLITQNCFAAGYLTTACSAAQYSNIEVTLSSTNVNESPEFYFSTLHTQLNTGIATATIGGFPDLAALTSGDVIWSKGLPSSDPVCTATPGVSYCLNGSVEAIDWNVGTNTDAFVKLAYGSSGIDCSDSGVYSDPASAIATNVPNTGRYLWTIPTDAGGAGDVLARKICVSNMAGTVYATSIGSVDLIESAFSRFTFSNPGDFTFSDNTKFALSADGSFAQLTVQTTGAATPETPISFTTGNSSQLRQLTGGSLSSNAPDYEAALVQLPIVAIGPGAPAVNPQFSSVNELWLSSSSSPLRLDYTAAQVSDTPITGGLLPSSGIPLLNSNGDVWLVSSGGLLTKIKPPYVAPITAESTFAITSASPGTVTGGVVSTIGMLYTTGMSAGEVVELPGCLGNFYVVTAVVADTSIDVLGAQGCSVLGTDRVSVFVTYDSSTAGTLSSTPGSITANTLSAINLNDTSMFFANQLISIAGCDDKYLINTVTSGTQLQVIGPSSCTPTASGAVAAQAQFSAFVAAIGPDDDIWLSGQRAIDCPTLGGTCYDYGVMRVSDTDPSSQTFYSFGLSEADQQISPGNPGSGMLYNIVVTKSNIVAGAGLFTNNIYLVDPDTASVTTLDNASFDTITPVGLFVDTNDDLWVANTDFFAGGGASNVRRISNITSTPTKTSYTVPTGFVAEDVIVTGNYLILAGIMMPSTDAYIYRCDISGGNTDCSAATGVLLTAATGGAVVVTSLDENGATWAWISTNNNVYKVDDYVTSPINPSNEFALNISGNGALSDFTGYQNTIITTQTSAPTGYDQSPLVVATSQFTHYNTSQWGDLDTTPFTYTATTPVGTSIKGLISFDGKSSDDATKTWKYFTGTAWATSAIGDIATNGNDIADLGTYSAADWKMSGGFTIDQTQAIDFAFALISTDPLATPILQDVTMTYLPAVYIPNTQHPTITLNSSRAISFTATEPIKVFSAYAGENNNGTFRFKLSPDNGTSWYWYNSATPAWEATTAGDTPTIEGSTPAVNAATQVAYWKFDNGSGATVTDVTGHGYDANLVGSPTWSTGKFAYSGDYSLTLDGASQYANVGTMGSTGSSSTDFSFEYWYKSTDPDPGIIIGEYNSLQVWGVIHNLNENGTSSVGKILIRLTDSTGAGLVAASTSAVSGLNDGDWHHVVYTGDASTQSSTLYFDGISVPLTIRTDIPVSSNIGNFTNPVYIGSLNITPGPGFLYYFNGSLDSLIVYDGIVGGAQALADYNAGISTPGGAGNDEASSLADINANIDDFTASACPAGTCSMIWKVFATAGSLAQLENINVGYGMTPPPPVVSGGAGSASVQNLTLQDPYALDSTSIRWVFGNNNQQAVSVRLYYNNSSNLIVDTGSTTFTAGSGLFVDETGLAVNTKYDLRYVVAYNNAGVSGSNGYFPAVYTLANTPTAPQYLDQTDSSLVLSFGANGNPSGTLMAIKEMISGQYIQANGTLGPTIAYLPFDSAWNNGNVMVSGLTTDNQYQFAVSAQNGEGQEQSLDGIIDGINTAFELAAGPIVTLGAAEPVILRKGVQVIPNNPSVRGVSVAGVSDKMAMNGEATLTTLKSVETAHQLANILLAILIALFIFSLSTIFKSLEGTALGESWIFLIPKILKKEASEFFGEFSSKQANGTFEYSFAHHKRLQNLSRTSLYSGFGVLAMKVALVLVVALFGANLKNSIANSYCFDRCDEVYPKVYPGDTLSFYIEYANNTSQTVQPATISDTLDADLSYSSLSAVLNGTTDTANVTGKGIAPRLDGRVLTFDIGSIPPRGTGFITFNTRLNADAAGRVSNQAFLNGQLQIVAAGGPVTASSNTVSLNISPLPCTADTWSCGAWNACVSGTQTRTCSMTFDCPAVSDPSPATSQSCEEIVPPVPPEEPVEPPVPGEPVTPPSAGGPETPGTGIPTEPTEPTGPTIPTIPTEPTAPSEPVTGAEEVSILTGLDNLVDSALPILNSPEIEKATEQIVIPTFLGLSAAVTIPAFVAGAFNVLPYLHLLFLEPLMALFGKRRQKYGVVYNALTKIPVDLAVIRMYDAKTKKLIATKITDKLGRFYILAKPGEYYLAVTKPGFIYPTVYLKDDNQDAKFQDVYHGEKIEVTADGTPITVSIPLDPKDKVVHQEGAEIRRFVMAKVKAFIPFSGVIMAVIGVIIYPTVLMMAFLGVHIGMYFMFRRFVQQRRPKSWGVVYDERTKKPLKHAVVRIFDTRFNKLLETYVTDGSGRYNFLVGPNQYQLTGVKEGYMEAKTKQLDLSKTEVEEAVVAEDFGLKKEDRQNVIRLGKSVDIPLKPEEFTTEPSNPEMHIEREPEQPAHEHKEISNPEDTKKLDLGNL